MLFRSTGTTSPEAAATPEVTGIPMLDQALSMAGSAGLVILDVMPVETVLNWYQQFPNLPLLQEWIRGINPADLLIASTVAFLDTCWPIGSVLHAKLAKDECTKGSELEMDLTHMSGGIQVHGALSYERCLALGIALPGISKVEENDIDLEFKGALGATVDCVWDLDWQDAWSFLNFGTHALSLLKIGRAHV